MPTVIAQLARWAEALSPSALPASVAARVRLQQIHLAGLLRSLRERPLAAALASAGASPLRQQATLGAWLELDDVLLGGRTGIGAVPAAWAHAEGHTLGQLDAAIAAGNEVGGRIGLATLLGPALTAAEPAVTAAAAATTAGKLRGLSAQQLAHAIALAVEGAGTVRGRAFLAGTPGPALTLGNAAAWGAEAAALAAQGATGDLALLDDHEALAARGWVVLGNAFTGLGKAWLSETLAFKHTPGPLAAQVAVQGLHEILRRHVKAADKRLRVDQVDRIEIRTGAVGYALARHQPALTPAGVVRSVRDLCGVLQVAHELGPAQLEAGWLASNAEPIRHIAGRISVVHDEARTVKLLEQLSEVLLPLFAGLGSRELGRVAGAAREAWGLPSWGAAGVFALLRLRPDQIRARLRDSSGDLADARIEELQYRYDTEVKVFTTRGGSWPERRAVPEGSPGSSWAQTVERTCGRLPAGEGARAMEAAREEGARDWVASIVA